jgi:hypothetical protein
MKVTGDGKDATVCMEIINEFTKRFEEDRCFTEVKNYIVGEALENALVIAATNKDPKIPIMILEENF